MESNMVKDNKYISYIKSFFRINFPDYRVAKEATHGPFWHIEFTKDETRVTISGDIGFRIVIKLFDTEYPLWQYDRSIHDKSRTNIENINYQLLVLQSFLED
jgi:hypothetical protein